MAYCPPPLRRRVRLPDWSLLAQFSLFSAALIALLATLCLVASGDGGPFMETAQ